MKKIIYLLVCLLAGIGLAAAQTIRVTGTVVFAEDGSPVPGASVVVKGDASIGGLTNVDGKFSFDVPQSAQTLIVKYLGMNDVEVPVSTSEIRVELAYSTSELEEVIVVAYGTATKGTFTGSAGVVNSEDLGKRQVSNVSQALSGAVAGVQTLNANAQPGVSATVRIRGVGSINAGTNPLYVVDGVPFDGDLSSINMNDVEKMTVLKDAASTALYGARGANGIIMITTKKGVGKATVRLDARYGVNSRGIRNYDVFTRPESYIETQYQAIYNAGIYGLKYSPSQAHVYANSRLAANSEGGSGYNVFTIPGGEYLVGTNGKLNPNATLGYSDGVYYYTPDNWGDEMFQTNPRQEYNVVISGAQTDFNYYASFGYLSDEGIIDNSGFSRISGRLKADYDIRKWLTVGANFNYNYSVSKYPGEQTATNSSGNAFFIANNIAPIYPIYVRDAATKQIKMNGDRKVYDYGDGISTNYQRGFMQIANPLGDLLYNKRDYMMDIINANWYAELKPVEGLTISARYGMHIDNTRHHDMGNAYMGQSAQYGGNIYQRADRVFGFDQQYLADYHFDMNDIHVFDLTAGYDGYAYQTEYVSAYGINMYNPENYFASNVIDQFSIGGAKDTYATQGYFARVNYSYDDKYFANVAFRRDASSRFHPDNRWGNFWSASAAWLLSKEFFMFDMDWVNMLKLKASYGQQGNDQIGNYYAYLDQYTVSGAEGVFSDGVLAYKGNPDITWETSNAYNIGIEFALFKDRLNGSLEYFGRTSSDMLYYKPVAGSVGYSRIPMNIGSMTNSGLEIDLSYNIIHTNDLKWRVDANATFIKNTINKLHPDLNGRLEDGSNVFEEGHSMYRFFMPEYAGTNPETGMALYWSQDSIGNRIKTDEYTDAQQYKISTDDLLPTVYGGFGTSVEAYGFDASVQFAYQLGGHVYDNGYARLMHGGTSNFAGNNWHKDILNAWTPDNKNTGIPRVNASDRYANSLSTRFIVSSDYLSLNNITVGYSVPSRLLKRFDISKLRVYFVADNLYLMSARNGLDPRQSFSAATTSLYTAIRSVSGGISLTF